MGDFFLKRPNTVAQYIVTRPILDLCEETVWWPGAFFVMIWWEQEGVDLAGARTVAEAAVDEEGEGGSEGGGEER